MASVRLKDIVPSRFFDFKSDNIAQKPFKVLPGTEPLPALKQKQTTI